MLISKEKLSAKAKTKLGLSTTVAAFWMAAIPFAGAAATSTQSTSAASAPASSTLEAQVQILCECKEGFDYGRLDSFEGILSGIVCGS